MKKTKHINPDTRYYGAQTQAAISNFPFSINTASKEIVYAMTQIKEATAYAHKISGEIPASIANAIIKASREVQKGNFDNQFFLPAVQGGAGTSIHMNVNEVIAARATELLHHKITVRPNDDVNKSQSTNDVGPSALKIAAIKLTKSLIATLDSAFEIFTAKSKEFSSIEKLGRTHLQDAVPTTLGEEFASYAASISRAKSRLQLTLPFLHELNLGGTAIGNCINASPAYRKQVYKSLRRITGLRLSPAKNLMSQTSGQTDFVMLSQLITSAMLDFSKIANDLRLLASGPNGGLGEIKIKELQRGSSIMPGKANPILPESVNQAYFLISGNNLTIEHAAQASQLELGVMFPVIADKLITSLKFSQEVINAFIHNCVATIIADEAKCREHLENSTAYATLLTPKLGYDQVSKMVKEFKKNGQTFQQKFSRPEILP